MRLQFQGSVPLSRVRFEVLVVHLPPTLHVADVVRQLRRQVSILRRTLDPIPASARLSQDGWLAVVSVAVGERAWP